MTDSVRPSAKFNARTRPKPSARPKPTVRNRPKKNHARKNAALRQTSRSATQLILFNKPWGTLCQFSGEASDSTLSQWIDIPGIYPAGRLDKDSEGLLLLTNNGRLQHLITHPKYKLPKTYWVQIEGEPAPAALEELARGVELKDGVTKPAQCRCLDTQWVESRIWTRNPPIRYRASIPTSWLSLTITEGRNRQVRRMTAAIGHPTLRLIRISIGPWRLSHLKPGEMMELRGQQIKWPQT